MRKPVGCIGLFAPARLRDSDGKQDWEPAMADDVSAALTTAEEVAWLWPDGPPRTIPDVGPESSFRAPAAGGADTTMLRNVTDASLTVFRPDPAKANGIGVIVAPGGGWRILAWQHEGIDLANWLAARGYTAFLLKYRVMGTPVDEAAFTEARKPPEGPSPYEQAAKAPRALAELTRNSQATADAREIACDDGVRAVELVRERADVWGVKPDRIGMIGFSAGAFLAVDVAMTPGADLAFVAPIYGGETSGRTVAADAPPLFTAIAEDDRMLFKVVEGLYADWSNADRPAELHIFARGGHGFGMVKRGLPVDRWIDLLGDWLADQGFA
jgi:acetyl esterase/lipase